MSDLAPSVLRRMTRRARPGGAVDAQAEALRIDIARIADEHLGLEAAVVSMSTGLGDRGEIGLNEGDLILQMTHRNLPSGLLCVSPELLMTLIEVQVAGRVSTTAPPERTPTRTDAVVVTPILGAWLAALQNETSGHPALQGFELGAMIPGPNAARLTLDSGRFASLSLKIALGGGAREGQMTFHLPEQARAAPGAAKGDLTFLTVELGVVLSRLRHPLGKISALAPGDVLEIDPASLVQASVEHDGRRLARVHLGRVDRTRAIRIASDDGKRSEATAFTRDDVAAGPGKKAIGRVQEQNAPAELEVQELLPDVDDDHATEQGAEPDTDLPPLDDLPPLEELPALEELPPLDDLPPLPELEEG